MADPTLNGTIPTSVQMEPSSSELPVHSLDTLAAVETGVEVRGTVCSRTHTQDIRRGHQVQVASLAQTSLITQCYDPLLETKEKSLIALLF